MKTKLYLLIFFVLAITLAILLIPPYIQTQKEIEQYSFTMDSMDGKVSLSDFDGRYKLIYYGYMYCPDICPTSLSIIASALQKLPKEQADLFQLIFISVDPDRDKLKDLKEYANYFHKGAIGLTSDKKYLKKISANYGTYYTNEYLENSKIDYSVAHTSFVYLIGKNGKLLYKLKHLEKTSDVLNIIKKLH